MSGLDLPKEDLSDVEKKLLPEAIDNMFLVARRIQARYVQLPKVPVRRLYDISFDVLFYITFLTLWLKKLREQDEFVKHHPFRRVIC